LECVSRNEQITKNFYFTGGTVLSEFYLKHRLSEDIDLFSEYAEVDPQVPEAFLRKISKKLGIKEFKVSQFLGLVSFILVFQDGETLKVDFNYYPFPRINKGKKYKNLDIDSLYDIAVNKVHTLCRRHVSAALEIRISKRQRFAYPLDIPRYLSMQLQVQELFCAYQSESSS